jgi:ribosomal protein S18 acetylase RimI-like enzyme
MTESTMELPGKSDLANHPDTKLRRVNWSKDLATVRRLFQDYRQWLADHSDSTPAARTRVQIGLTQVDRLIAELPGAYDHPRGEVILAFARGSVVACGALRELEPKVGEIKRVYVRADHRGPGFGPRLTRALLHRARELGYERVRVDTLPTMAAAIQFYPEMGFEPVPAYWPHPVTGALFFEYALRKPKRTPRRR